MKMRRILFLFAIVLFFVSCEKDSSKDDCTNVEQMEWFKEIKKPCDEYTICKLRIHKGLYNEDTVYFTSFVGALCDMVFTASIVNINGDTLRSYEGPEDLVNFSNEVQFLETIYRCEQ